nr:MAG TPA: hypothetical protein [Bacteriophage sp.]
MGFVGLFTVFFFLRYILSTSSNGLSIKSFFLVKFMNSSKSFLVHAIFIWI